VFKKQYIDNLIQRLQAKEEDHLAYEAADIIEELFKFNDRLIKLCNDKGIPIG